MTYESRESLVSALSEIVDVAEQLEDRYFYPPCHASDRRRFEIAHHAGPVEWTENGHDYTAEISCVCTCSRVIACRNYTRDGKKTTLQTVKHSLARLQNRKEG